MSIISENIKYLRNLNRLTQEQFSSRIGIKRSLLGAYEEARANPPLDKLKLIAQSFGVSVDALIKQDIRRMRETPDITLGFEKRNPVPEPRKVTELLDELLPPVKKETYLPPTEPPRVEIPVESRIVAEVIPDPPKPAPVVYSPPPTSPQSTWSYPGYDGSNQSKTFEKVTDFPIPEAWVVGEPVLDLVSVPDGKYYILETRPYGLIYRRLYNQIKSKGNFLLVSDLDGVPPREIEIKDIMQAWSMKGYFVWQIPPPPPSLSKVSELVEELQFELNRIKKNSRP